MSPIDSARRVDKNGYHIMGFGCFPWLKYSAFNFDPCHNLFGFIGRRAETPGVAEVQENSQKRLEGSSEAS
jgi:hypothetical protein